jgi:hypothetical protein
MNNYDELLTAELSKSYDKLMTIGYSETHLKEARDITRIEINDGMHSLSRVNEALFDNYEWVRGFTYDN